MKVLTEANFSIGSINSKAASDNILIEKGYTITTDGRVMAKVTKAELNIKGIKRNVKFPIVLKSATALKICSSGLKNKAYAVVKKNHTKTVEIELNNPENKIRQVFIVDSIDKKYSDYERVITENEDKDKIFSIDVNAAYLEQMCKLAKKFSDDGYSRLTLEFIDNESAITLKARDTDKKQDFLALIMPLSPKKV